MKNPFFFPGILAWTANALVWLILKSCRLHIKGIEHLTSRKERKQIIMFWHNRLTIAPQLLYQITPGQKYAAVVSNSRDGELLAQMVMRFQTGEVIRVPHDLRHEALRQMVKTLKKTDAIPVITPDGPRGPCYVVKGGVVTAAKLSNAIVIPMSWEASGFWEFNTWDRMRLPKPFSKLKVTFGEPIDPETISVEEALLLLENELNAISS